MTYDHPDYALGDRPSDEILAYLAYLVDTDRNLAHERKNRTDARKVRDSLSDRMRLAESASDWLERL